MAYLYDPVEPVVQTKYGKLRGYTFGDVNHFLGVRYAKAKRFHMPEEPDSWEGIKEAKTFGATMLQMNPYRPVARNMGLNIPWAESEDCYFLNIWAPRHDDGIKRPVFVYMHGGGFFAGSSIMEVENMEGFNVANRADVIFISMNLRLNVLGHLNLAD
ncbi:MAG: carboxylesterase family protein, partial [Oscillospiraceae bacterium]|nr:carboxylesterase family protein [Oscillospiraceae bacterium]